MHHAAKNHCHAVKAWSSFLPAVIPYLEIALSTLLLALFGAFSLGISKTGLPGLALLNVIIMAQLFEKQSVGIILPLLVFCDLVIYPMYHKYASWRQVWPLLIPAVIGVLVGYFILDRLGDDQMKPIIGWIVIGLLILQLVRNRSEAFLAKMPDSAGFLVGSGLAIGVSTTVANAAGPAFSVWAIVKRLSKEDFLGIGARFFLFVNLFKVPFIFQVGIINKFTLLLDAALLPAIVAGILVGRQIVKRIEQQTFEWVLFGISAIGAIWLICF